MACSVHDVHNGIKRGGRHHLYLDPLYTWMVNQNVSLFSANFEDKTSCLLVTTLFGVLSGGQKHS